MLPLLMRTVTSPRSLPARCLFASAEAAAAPPVAFFWTERSSRRGEPAAGPPASLASSEATMGDSSSVDRFSTAVMMSSSFTWLGKLDPDATTADRKSTEVMDVGSAPKPFSRTGPRILSAIPTAVGVADDADSEHRVVGAKSGPRVGSCMGDCGDASSSGPPRRMSAPPLPPSMGDCVVGRGICWSGRGEAGAARPPDELRRTAFFRVLLGVRAGFRVLLGVGAGDLRRG